MEWINLDVFEIFHQFIGEDDFVNKFTYLLLRY